MNARGTFVFGLGLLVLAVVASPSCSKKNEVSVGKRCAANAECVDAAVCHKGVCDPTTSTCTYPVDETNTPAGGMCHGEISVPAGACLKGNVPVSGDSDPSACGINGDLCKDCNSADPCKTNQCISGMCMPKSDNDICTDSQSRTGKCMGGVCCIGCWDAVAKKCDPGIGDVQSCGSAGAACQPCPTDECTTATCPNGVCGKDNKPDLTACSNNGGRGLRVRYPVRRLGAVLG